MNHNSTGFGGLACNISRCPSSLISFSILAGCHCWSWWAACAANWHILFPNDATISDWLHEQDLAVGIGILFWAFSADSILQPSLVFFVFAWQAKVWVSAIKGKRCWSEAFGWNFPKPLNPYHPITRSAELTAEAQNPITLSPDSWLLTSNPMLDKDK